MRLDIKNLSGEIRLAGFYFTYFAGIGLFTPYWSLYLKIQQYTALEIGVVMALPHLARIFGPPLAGVFADRHGRRASIVRFLSIAAVFFFVASLATRWFPWQVITLLLVFTTWSATLPLIEATTLDYLGGSVSRYGKIRLWGTLGFIATTMMAGYLIDLITIHILPALMLIALLCMAIWSFKIEDYPHSHPKETGQSFWAITRKKEAVGLFVSCFFIVLAHGIYNAFYSIHLLEQGYSESTIGWMWVISAVSAVILFLFVSRLMQHFSVKKMYALSFIVAVLRFLLIAWYAPVFWLMCVLQILHAFTFAIHHAASMAYLQHFYPGRLLSKAQAMYIVVSYGMGAAVGGLIAGALWRPLGGPWVFTLAALFALLGLIITRRYLAKYHY